MIAVPLGLLAQQQKIHTQQAWLQGTAIIHTGQSDGFQADFSARHSAESSAFTIHHIRAGAFYGLAKHVSGLTGFAIFRSVQDGHPGKTEYRPYQDVTYNQSLQHMQVVHRLRLESRFFRQLSPQNTDAGRSFQLRLRYRCMSQWPLARLSAIHSDRLLLLQLGDEIMVNPVRDKQTGFFSTNRILFSPTVQWGKHLEIAMTYNHQLSSRKTTDEFESAEIFWLNITHRFDLSVIRRQRRAS